MAAAASEDPVTARLVDQQLLVYFVAVAEELHFGRAASRTRVSQPALSKQVKRLEHLIGVQLFDRDRTRVALTDAGRRLLPAAYDVLSAGQRFIETSAQERAIEKGRLRVVFVAQAANEYTPLILRAFADQHPNVSVDLRQLGPAEVAEAVRSGSADIAILRLPIDRTGLVITELFSEQRVAVVAADHPAAGRDSIKVTELMNQPWIVNAAEDPAYQDFARVNSHRSPEHPLRVGAVIHSVDEYLEAVLAHRGIGLAPQSAVRYYTRPGIAYVPVPDAERSVVALAWADRGPESHPLAVAFKDVCLQQVATASATTISSR
jgi:DNA-binding transcriptional LysR family regulator